MSAITSSSETTAAEKAAEFPLTAAQLVEDLLSLEKANIAPSIFASHASLIRGADGAHQASIEDFLAAIRDMSDEQLRQMILDGVLPPNESENTRGESSVDAVSQYIIAVRWMASQLRPRMLDLTEEIAKTRKEIAESLLANISPVVHDDSRGQELK